MNLALLLPAALAALAALALPLLIHLARRSEQRPTDFAALRWLRAKPRPRSRIRFDELFLLLLRLLLLILIALWLARPALYGAASDVPWVAVAPGVDAGAVAAAVPKGARVHWLAPGFPTYEQAAPAAAAAASLLRELDATLPEAVALTVLVPAELDGADGQRPQLSREVAWKVLPGKAPAATARTAGLPRVAIRYTPERASSLPYLRAAVSAWSAQDTRVDAADIGVALPTDAQAVLWLATGPMPPALRDWVAAGGTVLTDPATPWPQAGTPAPAWRGDDGAVLAQAQGFGRGRVLRLTRAATPLELPQLLDPEFARQLRDLLTAVPAPTRANADNYRPRSGAAAYAPPALDLKPWLALLIAVVFLLERLWANRPRRSGAP
ncbi:BatA domain-containing protein [Lysobacter silvisoli]|uniref:Aerotolerance regulator N-terminal domain-containing protein n=1 Tax=Lysobacter silvisoli TaxID=2293254 RepID=A0A371K3I1_9GAMM|nr:BatA domain-containing protein [Lysobacter silvisoli]RDZ28432.1 hypothetical protein DX914_04665 [Lysobacter silvisoli]